MSSLSIFPQTGPGVTADLVPPKRGPAGPYRLADLVPLDQIH